MKESHTIDLEKLRDGVGCLSAEQCGAACQAVIIALNDAGHFTSVRCEVQDQKKSLFLIVLQWTELKPPSARRSWRQTQRLGEWAAEGIAFLIVDKFTPYTVVDQSVVDTRPGGGSGVDYYLGAKDDLDCEEVDDFPKHLARLEVSGILRPSPSNSLNARVSKKIESTKKSDSDGTPAIIIVVEFLTPLVNFTQRIPEDGGKSLSQAER